MVLQWNYHSSTEMQGLQNIKKHRHVKKNVAISEIVFLVLTSYFHFVSLNLCSVLMYLSWNAVEFVFWENLCCVLYFFFNVLSSGVLWSLRAIMDDTCCLNPFIRILGVLSQCTPCAVVNTSTQPVYLLRQLHARSAFTISDKLHPNCIEQYSVGLARLPGVKSLYLSVRSSSSSLLTAEKNKMFSKLIFCLVSFFHNARCFFFYTAETQLPCVVVQTRSPLALQTVGALLRSCRGLRVL